MFESFNELKDYFNSSGVSLHDAIIKREIEFSDKKKEEIIQRLKKSLEVMKRSLKKSIEIDVVLPIRDAMEQSQKLLNDPIFLSKDLKEAIYWAMSIAEYNSGMGLICAAPTAGSSGVFPAVLFKAKEMLEKSDEDLLNSFIVGTIVGVICGNRASLSGSEAGCQAEIGVASAMAAAAIVYLASKNIDKVIQAVALSIKNLLGLICDPVAGLVISPCIKRNTIGVMNAFLSSEMALSGVTSIIPADEVLDAMKTIGRKLPYELKETGLGGIAITPTGKKIKNSLFENK